MVKKIIELHKLGISGYAIAKNSEVSYNIIKNIISGRTVKLSEKNKIKVTNFINKINETTSL